MYQYPYCDPSRLERLHQSAASAKEKRSPDVSKAIKIFKDGDTSKRKFGKKWSQYVAASETVESEMALLELAIFINSINLANYFFQELDISVRKRRDIDFIVFERPKLFFDIEQ